MQQLCSEGGVVLYRKANKTAESMLLEVNKKETACGGHFDKPTKVYGAVNTYNTASICWIQHSLPEMET